MKTTNMMRRAHPSFSSACSQAWKKLSQVSADDLAMDKVLDFCGDAVWSCVDELSLNLANKTFSVLANSTSTPCLKDLAG
eukprot:7578629-Alexandrium_andersonii.AAC.1